MAIPLQAATERRIQEKLSAGPYRSVDEVVQEGLHLLEDRDRKRDALAADIRLALEQAERGETSALDMDALVAELRAKHIAKSAVSYWLWLSFSECECMKHLNSTGGHVPTSGVTGLFRG